MHLPELEYDWTRIYGYVHEEIPEDAPDLLENQWQPPHSLMLTFCMTSSLEGLLLLYYFFNLTPGDWYSKRQITVENATYVLKSK